MSLPSNQLARSRSAQAHARPMAVAALGSRLSHGERSGSRQSHSERSGSRLSHGERSGSRQSHSERSGSRQSHGERSGSRLSHSERSGSRQSPKVLAFVFTVSAVAAVAAVSTAEAEDVLVLRRSGTTGHSRLVGTIVDWTGQWVTFRAGNRDEQRLPVERIVDVQTPRTLAQQNAFKALHQQRWSDALRDFRTAAAEDRRVWMRRQIHADISLCEWNLGEIVSAVENFAIVCQSDPTHPYYDRVPLPWSTQHLPASTAAQATQWMSDEQPAKRLMGAGWLLHQQPQQALAALQGLLQHTDARIVALAEAQLWRRQVVVAESEDVDRWRQRVRAFPSELRAGPLHVVGKAASRLQQYEQAAIDLMRAPIEHPEQQWLAADGLLEAAAALQNLKRNDDATRLYRELLKRYPNTEAAQLAKSRAALEEQQE